MRISFDIDDTLACDPSVPAEPPPSRWRRLWYPEALRRGAPGLMRALLDRRHEIWIYTTSYRSPFYVRGWLRGYGVPVSGVVSQRHHDRVVGRRGPSKLPSMFGIGLHVDDSTGVAEEGRRYGFDVVVVAPDDPDWAERILDAVAGRRRSDRP